MPWREPWRRSSRPCVASCGETGNGTRRQPAGCRESRLVRRVARGVRARSGDRSPGLRRFEPSPAISRTSATCDLRGLCPSRPSRYHGCDGSTTSARRLTRPPRGSESHTHDLRVSGGMPYDLGPRRGTRPRRPRDRNAQAPRKQVELRRRIRPIATVIADRPQRTSSNKPRANPAERFSRIPQQVDALKLVRSSSDISIGTL